MLFVHSSQFRYYFIEIAKRKVAFRFKVPGIVPANENRRKAVFSLAETSGAGSTTGGIRSPAEHFCERMRKENPAVCPLRFSRSKATIKIRVQFRRKLPDPVFHTSSSFGDKKCLTCISCSSLVAVRIESGPTVLERSD